MKIGIVSNLYPPSARGGAELVAQRIADELYVRGHEVFVVTTKPFSGIKSLSLHQAAKNLGKVYRFFPPNLYHIKNDRDKSFLKKVIWHIVDLFNFHSAAVIRDIIEKEQPDIMMTHNLKGLGINASRAIQKCCVFHVHTLHDLQLTVPSGLLIYKKENSFLNRSIARKMYEVAVKWSIGNPDIVLSPSQYLADAYKERGFFKKSKVKVFKNPTPSQKFPERQVRIPGPIRFVFAGQLEEQKGVKMMLEVLDQFDFPIELHLAGEGSLSEYVTDWANKDSRVRYHGFVPLAHLVHILKLADAVIVPSLCYENSPTIIFESFKMGIPVIASRIGGIPEIVEDGLNGILIEPGNMCELVSAMKKVASELTTFWDKSEAIQEQAREYNLESYVDRLEKLIEENRNEI